MSVHTNSFSFLPAAQFHASLQKRQAHRTGEGHLMKIGQGAQNDIAFKDRDVVAFLVGYQKELARRVQGEISGPIPADAFPPHQIQFSSGWVYLKNNYGILPPVGAVEELSVWGQVDVRTVAFPGKIGGKGRLCFNGFIVVSLFFKNGNG